MKRKTEKEKRKILEYVITEYEKNEYTVNSLCLKKGISRATFYRWLPEFETLEQDFIAARDERRRVHSDEITMRGMTAGQRLLSTEPYHTRTIKFKVSDVPASELMKLYKGQDLPTGKIYDIEVTDTFQERPPNAQATLAVLYNTQRDLLEKNPQPTPPEFQREHIPIQTWVNGSTGQEVEEAITNLLEDGTAD